MDSYQQAIAALPDFLAGPLARMPNLVESGWFSLSGPASVQLSAQFEGTSAYPGPDGRRALYPLRRVCSYPSERTRQRLFDVAWRASGRRRRAISLSSRRRPQLTQLLQEHFIGLLVSGEPDSGKTTLLRSMAVFLAGLGKAVSIIDERQELWPPSSSYTRPPVDFIAGLPKEQAVQMALRTLAPQVILLDELGGMEEVQSLEQGFFSGVNYIASLHAASLEEALCRPQVAYMKSQKMLRVIVQLTGRQAPGQISGVHVL